MLEKVVYKLKSSFTQSSPQKVDETKIYQLERGFLKNVWSVEENYWRILYASWKFSIYKFKKVLAQLGATVKNTVSMMVVQLDQRIWRSFCERQFWLNFKSRMTGYLKGKIRIIIYPLHNFTHRPGFVDCGVFYFCLVLELQSAEQISEMSVSTAGEASTQIIYLTSTFLLPQ